MKTTQTTCAGTTLMEVTMFKSATISPCKQYRYTLERQWDQGLPRLGFVMLNPSTADASSDDPTVRKCIGFARAWGYGAIRIGNLFAYRATDPKELRKTFRIEGIDNNDHLRQLGGFCREVVAAWGALDAWPGGMWRADYVRTLFPKLLCIGRSKNGFPLHPLYQKYTPRPLPFWEVK